MAYVHQSVEDGTQMRLSGKGEQGPGGPGDALVTSQGTYPTLNYFVAGRGGKLHTVPYGAYDRQDLDALVAKAWEVDAKVLYVVNPDNPSGTWHSAARIEALI